jgi:hypothetical protein
MSKEEAKLLAEVRADARTEPVEDTGEIPPG